MSQSYDTFHKEKLSFCIPVFFHLTMKNITLAAAEVMQHQFLPYKLDVKLFTENWTSARALQNISQELCC